MKVTVNDEKNGSKRITAYPEGFLSVCENESFRIVYMKDNGLAFQIQNRDNGRVDLHMRTVRSTDSFELTPQQLEALHELTGKMLEEICPVMNTHGEVEVNKLAD